MSSEKLEISSHLGFIHLDGKALTWGSLGGPYVSPSELKENSTYKIDTKTGIIIRKDEK